MNPSSPIHRVSSIVLALGLAAGIGYEVRARADGAPTTNTLTYAGTLVSGGSPVTGSHTVNVSVLTAATGGTTVCSTGSTAVTVASNGAFTIAMPAACTAPMQANPNLYVDVNVDGQDTGTSPISAVPYALTANSAIAAQQAEDGGALATTLATMQTNINTSLTDDTNFSESFTAVNTAIDGIDTALTGRLLGVNATLVGLTANVNPSTTQTYWQGGSNVQSAVSNEVTITFPSAFPHALLLIEATAGDTSGTPVAVDSYSTTSFEVHVNNATGDVRINWFAIGW